MLEACGCFYSPACNRHVDVRRVHFAYLKVCRRLVVVRCQFRLQQSMYEASRGLVSEFSLPQSMFETCRGLYIQFLLPQSVLETCEGLYSWF